MHWFCNLARGVRDSRSADVVWKQCSVYLNHNNQSNANNMTKPEIKLNFDSYKLDANLKIPSSKLL